MSQAELLAALPAGARRHLDPASPLPMRMMAARGLAPLPPVEMLIVVAGLSLDADQTIAAAAREGLAKLPDKILLPALEQALPPAALVALAPALAGRAEAQQKLVLNRATPDEAIALVAVEAAGPVAEIIAENQERCLRSEAIVRAIAKNPNLLRSSLDRLFDFLVRSGVILGDMEEFAEAISRLSPSEMLDAAHQVVLPAELADYVDMDEEEHTAPRSPAADGGADEQGEEEAPERMSAFQLVASLSVSQKVAAALRGNKELRTLLVRDSNRVVASAAIRSPRVTEQEIVTAAQSRSVADEVIRIIANSKDMVRSYGVKKALVNNPKTPLPVAMRFLSLLRAADLKAVAKSKNVNTAVANQAKRLVAAKGDKG